MIGIHREQHITIIHEKRTPHSQTDRSKDVVDRWGSGGWGDKWSCLVDIASVYCCKFVARADFSVFQFDFDVIFGHSCPPYTVFLDTRKIDE